MQPVVSVQGTGDRGTAPAVRRLLPGQSVRFGACACGACGFDLRVPVDRAGSAVGRVHAHPDHWRLDNLGPVPLAVDDLEATQNLIIVPGGRTGVVVPFELAGVAAGQAPLVIVFGPEPPAGHPHVRPCPGATSGLADRAVDRHTTYFAVLVSLCEPRLRRPEAVALPTSAEIACDLRRRGIPVTARAVDWHIEYLVNKLDLRPPARIGLAKRSWRKEALVTAALRRALVGPEHLPPAMATGPVAPARPAASPRAGRLPPPPWHPGPLPARHTQSSPAGGPGDTVRG